MLSATLQINLQMLWDQVLSLNSPYCPLLACISCENGIFHGTFYFFAIQNMLTENVIQAFQQHRSQIPY